MPIVKEFIQTNLKFQITQNFTKDYQISFGFLPSYNSVVGYFKIKLSEEEIN